VTPEALAEAMIALARQLRAAGVRGEHCALWTLAWGASLPDDENRGAGADHADLRNHLRRIAGARAGGAG